MLGEITLCLPFYRNGGMLLRQAEEWAKYPPGVRIIVVDDGSPEPALSYLSETHSPAVQLYRIDQDIPWNREGARNLAAKQVETDWLIHLDIDHLLPAESVRALLAFVTNPARWYRFPRFRVGKADATRRKDALPDEVEFGPVKPHIDSYLMRKAMYWSIGGYDEDFSGSLGGGTEFLRRAEGYAKTEVLPPPICLHVYTRDRIPDASDWSLSRDRESGKAIAKAKARRPGLPQSPLRFRWRRVF